MHDIYVQAFTHLKDRPRADEALDVLQRVASLVKPIMRKHGWVLPVLSEFFPESPNLLDINSGQKILVRLRPPHTPNTFFDEEDILQTMLHELAHNVHGSHDDKFYKFLAGLEEEYATLRRSGYDGEGFHSAGRRLGTSFSHDLPVHLARQRAVDAAEKRRQISLVLSGGGRLGGAARDANKTPQELAAEAAERRARDDKACASASGAFALQEADKAAKESVQDDVIDLTSDTESSSGASEPSERSASASEPDIIVIDEESPFSTPTPPTPMSTGAQSPRTSGYSSSTSVSSTTLRPGSGYASSSSSISTISSSTRPHVHRVPRGAGNSKPSLPKPRSVSRPPTHKHSKPTTPPPTRSSSIAMPRHNAKTAVLAEGQWACPRCTFINDAALQCQACLALRPGTKEREHPMVRETNGWTCPVCGEPDMPRDFWSCRSCGSVKVAS
ncbi:WLM-domain-containing protein [Lentinus tigrinus ALCF2SS1-7]|uniref:WLM-domain-containing protein n=1 Tax=Lentinus tigrinus ALCF2SS1-7 TaxID=1328758 RepID=UPI00116637FD|nr:WLM-domain-containing protein [Lentinus tigrinus ALCF2SS1-7]